MFIIVIATIIIIITIKGVIVVVKVYNKLKNTNKE